MSLEANRKRVFVVDDNPVNLKLTAALVRRAGFAVDAAATAEEALTSLETGTPDLILTDLQLPGKSGLELARTVRSDPRWKAIPVVLLTAANSNEDAIRAREAGCECLIGKPIDTHLLGSVLRSLLGSPPVEARDDAPEEVPVEELRKEFLASAAKECAAIVSEFSVQRAFAPAVEYDGLRKTLHRWAGVGGTVGFPEITRRARVLQLLAEGAEPDRGELSRNLFELLTHLRRLLAEWRPAAAPARPAPAAEEAPAPARKVVLIADDDAIIRGIVRRALEAAGYDCLTADNGLLAFALARNCRPDAMILDINMPRMNGLEVLYSLRSLWSTRRLGVILLTARHDEQDIRRGIELGAAQYVTKPFEVAELVGRVRRLIAESEGIGPLEPGIVRTPVMMV